MAEALPDAPVSVPGVRPNWWDLPWEAFRCRQCQRLLLKVTRQALKPGAAFEIKCGACKTMNYMMGPTT